MATFNFTVGLKRAALLTAIFLSVPQLASAAAFGIQSSAKATQWDFDFVEEFDGLQDWDQSSCRNGSSACGNRYDISTPELMPKAADGRKAAWGYFSVWNTKPAPAPWIGSETASGRKVWRGNKSLTIDIGETNYGPSRFGLHMGDGYSNWSVFYMVWMPTNTFPTSCVGGACGGGGPVGTYTKGLPYTYFASYKFNTFSMDCKSSQCPHNGSYGDQRSLINITQYNYNPFGLTMVKYNGYDRQINRTIEGGVPLNPYMGEWFGFEMNIENINSDTQYQANIWIYDSQGNSVHVLRDSVYAVHPKSHNGGRWDHFFFGGNNANSWTWGPTMSSHYYVDDLIIDNGSKGRIGPRYFSRIGARTEIAPPSPPVNLRGNQVNAL